MWAVADWIHSQGEGAFGMFYLGAFSFVPALLAWLAGGVQMFMASTNRDVRFGVVLTTAHLVWWLLVVGIEILRNNGSWGWGMRIATVVEPCLYAVGDDMSGRTLVLGAATSRSRAGRGLTARLQVIFRAVAVWGAPLILAVPMGA